MRPGALLGVVNNLYRAVPTSEVEWFDDGQDVQALLDRMLSRHEHGNLSPAIVGDETSGGTFWATYRV